VQYSNVVDGDALEAFGRLVRTEGIIPAVESSHAVARACRVAAQRDVDEAVVVCLSGRGDKDVAEVSRLLDEASSS
jgi:tryptophan synthase beta chain